MMTILLFEVSLKKMASPSHRSRDHLPSARGLRMRESLASRRRYSKQQLRAWHFPTGTIIILLTSSVLCRCDDFSVIEVVINNKRCEVRDSGGR